jgi:hypothetical protein
MRRLFFVFICGQLVGATVVLTGALITTQLYIVATALTLLLITTLVVGLVEGGEYHQSEKSRWSDTSDSDPRGDEFK